MLKEVDPCDYPKMLHAEVINENQDGLNETFGVDQKRVDDLVESAVKLYNDSSTLGEALVKISKLTLHANELIIVIMHITRLQLLADEK